MGRIPLPGPFFSSAIAATLAARALGATELLADLAAGTRRGTIALGSRGTAIRSAPCATRARRKAAEWVVSGEKPFVVDGHTRRLGHRGGPQRGGRALLPARASPRPSSSRRSTPPASWPASCSRTRRSSRSARRAARRALWQRIQDDIAIALAAETVGAADRALAEAIAYTSQRIVFDKPVATYQTVRHRLVEMFQQVEMARAGVQFAAWASDTEAPERGQAAAMAAELRRRGRRPGDRRRHPAARRRRLHLGQRRPLPLQAGEAERGPDRRGRLAAAPPGLAVHRVGLSRAGRAGRRFELRPIAG